MSKKFVLDGVEYDADKLSPEGMRLLDALSHVSKQLQEAQNMRAILTRAKNSYMSELKAEMVRAKTGLDLGELFADD